MKEFLQHHILFDQGTRQLICQGDWSLMHLQKIKKEYKSIVLPVKGELTIDGEGITKLDSAGAWLLSDYIKQMQSKNLNIHLQGFSTASQKLLELVQKQNVSIKNIPTVKSANILAQFGFAAHQQIEECHLFLMFIGQLTIEALGILVRPRRMRWRGLVSVIDQVGCQALMIVLILSFMIGIVLAYQMGLQLKQYGANIYIVDLLGLSVLREFAPLITAIMLAGRTGSAFTAQLGVMKINQEIDALSTMGITPAELLLLPRIMGLFIALPLLTIWADIFGVIGGMVMAHNMLGINWYDFLSRFQHVIPLHSLIIGLGKAPIFALIIGTIGCFEGMQVKNTADSIGTQTTRSVVLAIFFIIIADAIFSILFSKFNL